MAEENEEITDHEVEHGHHAERPDYDPERVDLPSREPPLRSTAPQDDFTFGQVTTGFVVLAVGLLLTFGLAFVLA